jgi:tetratricopeptide (TPR) repeat protein
VDGLLDQAEKALADGEWALVVRLSERVLTIEPENADAPALLAAAQRGLDAPLPSGSDAAPATLPGKGQGESSSIPSSFANGRYVVKRFLGEGGKKKVYLAHDTLLDRDIAFALIKMEGLDEAAQERVSREAQAMGRLGSHPHIVTVFDIGDEAGQPYLVLPLLPGGDVEGLIEKADGHRLPIEQAIKLAIDTCQGLEFAHSKGIVHRDLKPGNVWLAEDGRAMIGDFGLAVAMDRSRLTQAGMMVGTVSYMPPEQAMGGEITPRSDLYSLGAMLYEMVCGRPPFVGDESVAIIGQHLNTPPVAPAWHRPDCPPGMEALILRLLEKDPSKRPGAAREVREALTLTLSHRERGSASEPSPSGRGQGEGSQGPDPLYRGAFVGREPELRQLRDAYDAATSGQGSLAMVVGEPGIGKTALCEQLATYVAMRGGKALVGHCYEEGSLSLPYLAFVEALRTYVLAREPAGLRADLGSAGPEVARIVSEVRDRADVQPSAASGDPDDDRWRLLQAVTSFLRNAASVQPLLIVLEDLHWADRGTLDLLLHVARNLQGSRLLIIGTYRDVEVDRAHPLSSTLAELRRVGSLPRLQLRGLTVEEVQRMYGFIRGQEVTWARAEAVHRQTEGNPLFVQEVIRYMVEEGYIVREGGRWVITEGTGPETGIPEGLRDVVGKRLNRLSEKTNQVLSIAAVMGREFRLDVLQQVSGLPEEDVVAALEEANERAVVEQRQALGAIAFHFTHAFFRSTLYEEMFAPRRIRLHQQVGRALEQAYARRLEEHAAELAEHFAQSTEREDLEKALHYCELAAQRAMSVFAYGEAERHLQQALNALEVLDPDDATKRCDLLLALGDAMLPQEDTRQIAETVAPEAFELAEALGDSARAVKAALHACEAIMRAWGGRTGEYTEALRIWASRAAAHALPETDEGVYSDVYLGWAILEDNRASGHDYMRRAVMTAHDLSAAPFFAAAGRALNNLLALKDRQLVEALAREVSGRERSGARSVDLALCLTHVGFVLIEIGERPAAEAVWRDLAQLAERTRDVGIITAARGMRDFEKFIDGQLEDAWSLGDALRTEAREMGLGLGGIWAVPTIWPLGIRLLIYLGRPAEITAETDLPGRATQAFGAVALAHAGHLDAAANIVRRFGNVGSPEDESGSQVLLSSLEVSILCENKDLVEALVKRFAPFARELHHGHGVSIGRLLGNGSLLLGKPDEARSYYMQALAVSEKVRFRPEISLIRLNLAELLLEYYPDERDAAIEHLDFAISEFREMKMQPSLERALRHRGLLKA